jgi:hypothetical protein
VTAIGPTAFALLAWGSLALVLGVFAYEVYAVLAERR